MVWLVITQVNSLPCDCTDGRPRCPRLAMATSVCVAHGWPWSRLCALLTAGHGHSVCVAYDETLASVSPLLTTCHKHVAETGHSNCHSVCPDPLRVLKKAA
jgi:hypothetical protein